MSYAVTLDVAFATASGLEVRSMLPVFDDDDDDDSFPPHPGCAAPESAEASPASVASALLPPAAPALAAPAPLAPPPSPPPPPTLAPAVIPAPTPQKRAKKEEKKEKKADGPLKTLKNPAAAEVKPRAPSGSKRKSVVVLDDENEDENAEPERPAKQEELGRAKRRGTATRKSYADFTPDEADRMLLDDNDG